MLRHSVRVKVVYCGFAEIENPFEKRKGVKRFRDFFRASKSDSLKASRSSQEFLLPTNLYVLFISRVQTQL